MERAAKRPRLAHGQDSNGASQNTHPNHQESSRFDGTGIAIRDGTVQVHGDLYVNSSHAPEMDDTISRRYQILESLRFEQIDARQLSIKKALSKTCRWFLNTESYQQWSSRDLGSDDDRFLWIKGKPGAGKSTLMRFLLEHNQSLARRLNNKEVLISFFFNARGESLEKSTIGLYRSLLLQLLEARPELQQVLDVVRPGHPWNADRLKDLFDKAVQALEEVSIICFIDALDECDETQIRDMVRFLSDLVENGSRLHICFASRHYPHITIQTGLSIILEDQNEHENDISHYIDARLHLRQGKQAEEIRLELREKASGVFIWVVLVVEILNKEYEAGRTYTLHERLRQLPSNLHHLFRDILTRDNKDRDRLLLCIQWILFAKSPLTPVQLYFALISGVEPAYLAQSHSEDYSDDNIRRFVLNNSKGLAEPTKSRNSTIQFIHESVRDFLLKERGLCEIFPELQGNVIGQSNEALKQCCLTYMSMESVANLEFLSTAKSHFPFLAYANQGVLHHADQAESNGLSQKQFLAAFPHSRWIEHYNFFQRHNVRQYSPRVSLRYIMAEAGMSALIRVLPADQSCFDVEDERYGLPILAAAAAKNHDTVLAMLELEAQGLSGFSFKEFCSQHPRLPDRLNTFSRNFAIDKRKAILPQLIRYGNEMLCVFYLLTKDDIDLRDSQNATLMTQALEKEFIEVAKLLVERGVDDRTADMKGETALSQASLYGSVEIVKLLLDRQRSMNKQEAVLQNASDNGYSLFDRENDLTLALYKASVAGHLEVAKLLLDHGADLSAKTNDGATPLHGASQFGHVKIVKLLLDYGADASPTTKKGETPLYCASGHDGSIEAVKLLLDHGADISATTNDGVTPLHRASKAGHFKLAQLLLEYKADVSAIICNGATPLHLAAMAGNFKVAQLLLEYKADASALTEEGATPLHWASNNGHVDVAQLLLDRGADISAITVYGATPLHWASQYGHVEVAKLLLNRGANISAVTENGGTPLHRASQNGRIEVIRLLLDRGADISVAAKNGEAPLLWAFRCKQTAVVELLLDRGAYFPATRNSG